MQVITKGEAGGAQTHVLELCRALQAQVRLSAAIGEQGPASNLGQNLQALGVPVMALPSLSNALQPWRLWRAVRDLLRLIAEHRPDLLHVHSAVAGVVARIAGKISQTPVVYTVHGFGFKPQAPARQRRLAWWAEALLAAWTTRMVCVSDAEQRLAWQLPLDSRRVSVIPNAVADSALRADPGAEPARIVMVARMASPKRHDLLLLALQQLAARGLAPPTRCLGDGPLRAAHTGLCQQLGLTQVVLAGDVQDVARELAEHQIFVLLSDHEGLPISVIEAMRAGLAIVASRLPGIEELITHGQTGWLVEPDPHAVAQALQTLLQSPQERARLGAAARAAYEKRWVPDVMAPQLLQVYQEAQLLATARWPMTLPRAPAARLASQQARRQQRHLGWTLLGSSVLALAWMVGESLRSLGWATQDFSRTVLACVLPYAAAAHLLYGATRLPAAERGSLLAITVALPFVLTPLGFALLQQPYSRGAVLLTGLLTWGWFWLAERSAWRQRPLRLLVLQPGLIESLRQELAELGAARQAAALQLLPCPAHWRAQPAQMPTDLALDGVVLQADTAEADLDAADRQVLTQLKLRHTRLYASTDLCEALSGRTPESRLRQTLWQPDGRAGYDLVKRVLDLGLVLALLPLWLPLSLAVALAVRLDSSGPVLFGQIRTGLHGQPFRLWKFRSMQHAPQATAARFAERHDPRITRLGRWLRRSRLDELPQLFNVLRGEMSLIGPRPEQAALVDTFARELPGYPYRHLVRPGLTGWAQVQQGYAASTQETAIKLSHDLYYVTHYGLAMDLLIALRTVRIVLTGWGAR